jgi:hypothetical protein
MREGWKLRRRRDATIKVAVRSPIWLEQNVRHAL